MERKALTGIRKSVAVVLLLAANVLLTGCSSDLKNFFRSDASMKRMAKEDLKERYGEEFVVHKVWGLSMGSYAANCSPKADSRVVFEIGAYKDGTGIYSENYGKSAVAAKISQKLEEELQEYFPGCYVYTSADMQIGYLNADNVRDITLEEYAERCPREEFSVHVYVDKGALKEDSIEAEYQYFSETLLGEIKAGEIPYVSLVYIHYVDARQLQICKDYFKESCDPWDDVVEEGYKLWVASCYEKINQTYEEYEELRRGGM